ncbi:hypothetical protein F4804DRAFT_166299 [Jackrogersella minutella]|nr:hypothetical protein F4804DRAFT_166299 [Jackrogersella minutella]
MSAKQQSETPSELATNLRSTTTYITGHNAEGKAIVHSTRPASWQVFEGGDMGFNQIFTNTFPADLNNDADVKYHDDVIAGGKLGLATKNGVVCRMVDFGPQYECMMHRTKSLDFGILIEGEVELVLDDGKTTLMKPGDITVQRSTIHAWRNPSTTNWARVVFVLQDIKALVLNGEKFGEYYGKGTEGVLPSGNDDDE